MGRSTRIIAALATMMLLPALTAQADDSGIIATIGADKKINKTWTLGGEFEFRSRNDFQTVDRFSVAVNGRYKLTSWLKADARYELMVDNRREKLTLNEDGSYKHWRPSFYSTRHRFALTMIGDVKWGRLNVSLRERYQYTYRPEAATTRYDFDKEDMEDCIANSKHKHVLRSRLKLEYDIPKCKFAPWAAAEAYTSTSFEKARFSMGGSYSIKKKHSLELGYMYQVYNHTVNPDDVNSHHLTVGYNFKF